MESVQIRGPVNGYLTNEKSIYRKKVWEAIFSDMKENIGNKKVLIFPANNDEEIKILINNGIQEKNIFACDENPAILASSPWRKQYPGINSIGVKLEKAIHRLKKQKTKIDIANFDFCSNLCESVFLDISSFIYHIASEKFYFAVTILKGRESNVENLLAKMLFKDIKGCADRLEVLFHYLASNNNIKIKKIKKDEYKSGRQYMSFGVATSINRDLIRENVINVFKKNRIAIERVINIDNAFYKLMDSYCKKDEESAMKKHGSKRRYRKGVCNKLRKLKNHFFKKRSTLDKKIEMEANSVDGYGYNGCDWVGKNIIISYSCNEALWRYKNLMDIRDHRISYYYD